MNVNNPICYICLPVRLFESDAKTIVVMRALFVGGDVVTFTAARICYHVERQKGVRPVISMGARN